MKAKIMFIQGEKETIVGTMKSTIEAFQAASLFQSMLHNDFSGYYAVDWKDGKTLRRSRPDNLQTLVCNLANVYNNLKPIFNNH